MLELSRKDAERFASYHQPVTESGCWLWSGPATPRGYGVFGFNGQSQRAHRVSYSLAKGSIPAGIGVCHKCDTPACINPDHLFLGDQKANIADAVAKGRVTTLAANAVPRACRKLTDAQVLEVLSSPARQSELAARFGVDKSVIRLIRRRKTYRWVQAVSA